MGIVPIIVKNDFFSCANIFIPYLTELDYGDCSLMVERVVVDYNFLLERESSRSQRELSLASRMEDKIRKTRVRFSPFTLLKEVLK